MTGRKTRAAVAALALCSGLGACTDRAADGNAVEASAAPSVLKALDDAPGLDATARMVKRAGLDRMLDGVGSYTIFAPTDAAIAALPEADRQRLSSDAGRPQLIAMLRQHVAPGYIGAADMEQGLAREDGRVEVATVGGGPITVRRVGTMVVFGAGDDAPKLTGRPIAGRNGVVFPIDRVLPPPATR